MNRVIETSIQAVMLREQLVAVMEENLKAFEELAEENELFVPLYAAQQEIVRGEKHTLEISRRSIKKLKAIFGEFEQYESDND